MPRIATLSPDAPQPQDEYGGVADGTQSLSKSSAGWEEVQASLVAQADQPQRRRDRLRVRSSLRCRTAGARSRTGALVQDLHRRSSSSGRLARSLQDQDCRDGVDRRVLDPDLRDLGRARLRGRARQFAAYQERSGTQERCLGLSVDPGAPQRRVAARKLSDPPRRSSRCVPICGIEGSSSKAPLRTSGVCKRFWCR